MVQKVTNHYADSSMLYYVILVCVRC